MYKYKAIFPFLMAAFMVTAAHAQGNPEIDRTKTISGTVGNIDFVGNTVSILTADQHQMSFIVPNNAIITRDTQDIGLMDIKPGHPVTIKYDNSSSGKNSVDSIVDNSPIAQE